MKEITIKVQDNCELKQDGNTYTIVEKEKKITYDDIAKELFKDRKACYVCSSGIIATAHCIPNTQINCTSNKQAEKLLAINKLINVAKYLNNNWQPDWNNNYEDKFYIYLEGNRIGIGKKFTSKSLDIYFECRELAKQAIEILGEKTIKLALCTDY